MQHIWHILNFVHTWAMAVKWWTLLPQWTHWQTMTLKNDCYMWLCKTFTWKWHWADIENDKREDVKLQQWYECFYTDMTTYKSTHTSTLLGLSLLVIIWKISKLDVVSCSPVLCKYMKGCYDTCSYCFGP